MMVSPFRDLRQVLDREFDLELSCTACRRQRLIVTAVVLSLFTRMGWSTAWERVPARFRCRSCDARRVRVGLTFRARTSPPPKPTTLLATLRPPPRGVSAREWYTTNDGGRRRLADSMRS